MPGIAALIAWLRRRGMLAGAVTVVLINLVLVGAYFWSRGGQAVVARVEADGNEFRAYLDGRLHVEDRFAAPQAGGIVLALDNTRNIPSLPEPRGIDSVRVIDLATGKTLFEDDFSDGISDDWTQQPPGVFEENAGVLSSDRGGRLILNDARFADVAVEATFRNIRGGAITVRALDEGPRVSYGFRPFRHQDNGLAFTDADGDTTSSRGRRVQLDEVGTVQSIVAMILRPYPLAVLSLLGGIGAVALLQTAARRQPAGRMPQWTPDIPWLAIGGIIGAAFAILLYLNYVIGDGMPHVPDSVSFIFQAKVLASGRFAADPPPVAEVFEFFQPPFVAVSEDGERWASIYPIGHPILLAAGELVGAVWLVPPAIGALNLGAIYLIGRRVYAPRVGVMAALLLATSPFFLMTASNFMGHNTAAFYILGSLLFLAFLDRRPLLFGVLAGFLFGMVFNTRPLTGVALVLPFGAYLLTLAIPEARRLLGMRQIAAFVAGGLIALGLYLLYNWGTTGDALSNGYQANADLERVVGFGGRHTPAIGLENEQTHLGLLLLVLNGWPQYVGLAFVLLPFIAGTRRVWDWFLLAGALVAGGAYFFYAGTGIMHGPRYWYETTPFLMLLAARGVDVAAGAVAGGASWLRSGLARHHPGEGALPATALAYMIVFALVGAGVYGWLLGNHTSWNTLFVPAKAADLKGFNFTDDRLIELVDEAGLEQALVLVEPCPQWWCYGSVFWKNTPELDGDVVYAKNVASKHGELFEVYPDRRVYVASYGTSPDAASLQPYPGGEERAGVAPNVDDAPVAREISSATPISLPEEDDLAGRRATAPSPDDRECPARPP